MTAWMRRMKIFEGGGDLNHSVDEEGVVDVDEESGARAGAHP